MDIAKSVQCRLVRCKGTDEHRLSDLAIDLEFQKCGIGKQLQIITQAQLNNRCKLILISAPAANDYYDKIGYSNNPRCWVLERSGEIYT